MVSESESSKTAKSQGLAEQKARLRIWEWLRHYLQLQGLRSHSQLHLKGRERARLCWVQQKAIPQYTARPRTSHRPLSSHFLNWNEFLNTAAPSFAQVKKHRFQKKRHRERRKKNRFLLEKGNAFSACFFSEKQVFSALPGKALHQMAGGSQLEWT